MKSKKKYLGLFERMIKGIQERVTLNAIILFGSQARGTAHKYSDYDILVVADFQEEYWDRTSWVVDFTPDISVDLFCYTPSEFDQMFNAFRLTPIDAIGEGIVLFGEEFIAPYKAMYEIFLTNGMRKTNCVLIPPQMQENVLP